LTGAKASAAIAPKIIRISRRDHRLRRRNQAWQRPAIPGAALPAALLTAISGDM
jgi:hypothetical protein